VAGGFYWNYESGAKAFRLLLTASNGEHRLQEALRGCATADTRQDRPQ